jgi:hypothetical protein
MFKLIGLAEDICDGDEYEKFITLRDSIFKPTTEKSVIDRIDQFEYMEEEGLFIEELKRQDPDVVFYEGMLGDQEVIGIKHSGFNQIFTSGGENLSLESLKDIDININYENISWLLSNFNSVNSMRSMGKEIRIFKGDRIDKIIAEKGIRYIIKENEDYIAGIHIKNGIIENIYTSNNRRQQGLGKELINRAIEDHPNLKYSDSKTELGKKFANKTPIKKKLN